MYWITRARWEEKVDLCLFLFTSLHFSSLLFTSLLFTFSLFSSFALPLLFLGIEVVVRWEMNHSSSSTLLPLLHSPLFFFLFFFLSSSFLFLVLLLFDVFCLFAEFEGRPKFSIKESLPINMDLHFSVKKGLLLLLRRPLPLVSFSFHFSTFSFLDFDFFSFFKWLFFSFLLLSGTKLVLSVRGYKWSEGVTSSLVIHSYEESMGYFEPGDQVLFLLYFILFFCFFLSHSDLLYFFRMLSTRPKSLPPRQTIPCCA